MDKLSMADVLEELGLLFSLHSVDVFPTLALLHAVLQKQAAQSEYEKVGGCLQQVRQFFLHSQLMSNNV